MRIDYARVSPNALRAAYGLQVYANQSRIETRLRHLVTLRASQINGCAFCMEMHSRELREDGETQIRMDCLPAWRETSLYTDRERAALEWVEAVTLVSETHVPDDVFDFARQHFDEEELVDLTMATAAINVWNRLAVAFRAEPGVVPAGV